MPVALGALSQTSSLLLRLFQPTRLSPYGISFASVPAVEWKVLSFLPCLTLRSKELDSAWPLRSRDITLLLHYYGTLRHPAAFGPFPVSAVIGPTFSKDFSLGHTGLLQFLSSPCYRVAATTPPVWTTP